jgi:hypothetical protein
MLFMFLCHDSSHGDGKYHLKEYTVYGKRTILKPNPVTGLDVRYQLLGIQNKNVSTASFEFHHAEKQKECNENI